VREALLGGHAALPRRYSHQKARRPLVRFEYLNTVAAPRDVVWALLVDTPRVARCVPGVTEVEPLGADRYRGVLNVVVGPVRLTLTGLGEADYLRGEICTVVLHISASETRIGGSVFADIRIEIAEGSRPSTTDLKIVTEVEILGRIGELGQPLIRRKADQMMSQFEMNLSRAVTEGLS
jgi:carbon monoxide dehydrogenase subunit G